MRFQWILILLIFPGLTAGAQEEQVTPTPTALPTPPPRQILFSVFVWPSQGIMSSDTKVTGIPRAFYDAPTGPQSIVLGRNKSTPLLPYQGPQPLRIYDAEYTLVAPPPDAPAGTLPIRQLVKKPFIVTNIPDGLERVMLLVIPERKAADGSMMTLVMPYESDSLKPGMARIQNGSNRTLVIQFETAEGKLLRLPPNQSVDFSPDKLAGSLYPRIYIYELGEGQDLKLRHSSKIYFEEEKTNFFLVYPKGEHRLRILRLGGHVDPRNLTEILDSP